MVSSDTAPTEKTLTWQVAPQWQQRLAGAGGIDLATWQQQRRLAIVKQGPHRVVYRIDLPQPAGTLFMKHYRSPGLLRAAIHLLRHPAARREWSKALQLRDRHITTIEPVAVGQQKRGLLTHDSYFLSEGIPDSLPLDVFASEVLANLPPDEQLTLRRQVIAELARLTAQLHRAGVRHDDFHAGNILVRRGVASNETVRRQPLELVLIDLPCVSVGRPLGRRASLANLTMLGSAMLDRTTAIERFRFLTHYARHRADLPHFAAQDLGTALEDRCLVESQRVVRSRDTRPLRDNRDFRDLRRRGVIAHAVREMTAGELEQLADQPELPLQAGFDHPLKLGRRSVVVKSEIACGGRFLPVAYKRCRPKSGWKALFSLWRPSAAKSAWLVGHALLVRGIATARPLAVVERKGWRTVGYLATEWIEGGENLHVYLWRVVRNSDAARRRLANDLATELGRLIGRMHRWQISHRDLKACNLMVVETDDGPQTLLIDVDGVRIRRRLSAQRRARDLARLAISVQRHPWLSPQVGVRFLRAYAEQLPPGDLNRKRLLRDVEQYVEAHRRRFQRRGEPVA